MAATEQPELWTEFAKLRQDMRTGFAELRQEMAEMETRLSRLIIGAGVAIIIILGGLRSLLHFA